MAMSQAARSLVLSLVFGSLGSQAVLFSGNLPSFPVFAQPQQWNLHADHSGRGLLKRGAPSIHELTFGQLSYNLIVEVGPVSLRVAIDTGSADAWILASNAQAAKNKLPTYLLDWHSTTFVDVDRNQSTYTFGFADGTSGTGFIARETFVFENFTVPGQAFALIQSTDIHLGEGQDGVSGLVGLGFSRLSRISQTTQNATTILERLAREGQLAYPMFGISLTGAGGSLSLGAIDASVVPDAALIEWHDVVPFPPVGQDTRSSFYLHWAVELDSIQVNGSAIDISPQYREVGKRPLALIDVGSSGIFGPYGSVSRIFDQFESSRMVADGVWAVPCDSKQEMTFNFGGKPFILQPADYIMGEATGNPGTCLSWPVAVPPGGDGLDWQFGQPFLRKVYTVFSYGVDTREPPLIGFYLLPNSTSSTSASMSDNVEGTTSTYPSIATTLPNSLLSEPTPTTPPYVFNTSATIPTPGGRSGFGTSTYSPVLRPLNATAIPTAVLPASTFITTDPAGHSITTTSRLPVETIILGRPDGMNDAVQIHIPRWLFATVFTFLALAF
ncbi:aspartic peptidase domain-containing protein [Auriculariales sp. MPI-PUGE-AT-0066]|nr:aspartic peptidase domain-containing protein [Auriculariales sp. MPI-PUGE-AT-0066]